MGAARTRGDYATRKATPLGRVLAPEPSTRAVVNPADHYVAVEQAGDGRTTYRLERRAPRRNAKHVRRTLRACANGERRIKNGRN